jgi:hypothetical protein
VGDNDALVKAIRQADMAVLLPKLLSAAESILRRRKWSGGTDFQPSAMEARELLNETLMRIFEDVQCPQFDGDVRAALVNAMTSVGTSTSKNLRRVSLTGDIEELDTPPDQRERAADGDAEILKAVEDLVAKSADAELDDYFVAVQCYGPKREDIAAGLGWKPEKVSVVSKRLKRLLTRTNLQTGKPEAGNE